MAIVGFLLFVVLVAPKTWLMRIAWRMAGEQGKSRWLCFAASIPAASIVCLALYMSKTSEARLHRLRESEK